MLRALTRRRLSIALAALPILLIALAPSLAAKPHKHHGKKPMARAHGQEGVRIVFVPVQREQIREYFIVQRANLPRAYFDDADDLPPGLRKQLFLRGHLPPGIEKNLHPFPNDLDGILGPTPPCCRRVIIGRDAYLVDQTSNRILDILSNVLTR